MLLLNFNKSIRLYAKSSCLIRLLSGFDERERFWIGGTCLGNDRKFYWMGNEKGMAFTDWIQNEPNNAGGGEDCIEICPDKNYRWNDFNCVQSHFYVCEGFRS